MAGRPPATRAGRNRPGQRSRPPIARPRPGKREAWLPSPRSPPWPAPPSTPTPGRRAGRASPATGSMGRSREASRSPSRSQSCGPSLSAGRGRGLLVITSTDLRQPDALVIDARGRRHRLQPSIRNRSGMVTPSFDGLAGECRVWAKRALAVMWCLKLEFERRRASNKKPGSRGSCFWWMHRIPWSARPLRPRHAGFSRVAGDLYEEEAKRLDGRRTRDQRREQIVPRRALDTPLRWLAGRL